MPNYFKVISIVLFLVLITLVFVAEEPSPVQSINLESKSYDQMEERKEFKTPAKARVEAFGTAFGT